MDLSRYVDDLQRQLATAAAAGGDEAREVAARLAAPLESAVRLILLEALSEAAGEISAELAPGSVDVRLRVRDPELIVTPPPSLAPAPSAEPSTPALAPEGDEGATTRTTLRIPDHLKTQVETAAARDGVSVNTWLVRAVSAALELLVGPTPTPARPESWGTNRVTGWVR